MSDRCCLFVYLTVFLVHVTQIKRIFASTLTVRSLSLDSSRTTTLVESVVVIFAIDAQVFVREIDNAETNSDRHEDYTADRRTSSRGRHSPMFDSNSAWTCGDPCVYTPGTAVVVIADHSDCPTTKFEHGGGQGEVLPHSRMPVGGELSIEVDGQRSIGESMH